MRNDCLIASDREEVSWESRETPGLTRTGAELFSPQHSNPPASKSHPEIKKILVPIDSSDSSGSGSPALERAATLARQWDASITLLHVVDLNLPEVPTSPANVEQLKMDLSSEAMEELSRLAAELIGRRIRTTISLVEGSVHQRIVEAASHFDMIVMGQKKRGELSYLFSRKTAQRVSRLSPCPVLLIPEREAVISGLRQ